MYESAKRHLKNKFGAINSLHTSVFTTARSRFLSINTVYTMRIISIFTKTTSYLSQIRKLLCIKNNKSREKLKSLWKPLHPIP